jgi:hypothetical protein
LYRRKHLQSCLATAKEKDGKEAEKQILAIIPQEKDITFWRCINYVLGKQSSEACFKVQVPQEDGGGWSSTHPRRIFTTQFGPIFTGKDSTLQKKHPCAPETCKGNSVISQTPKITRAILAGNYAYSTDFDQATREIFKECAKIWLITSEDLVATTITPEAWWSHWSKANKKTYHVFQAVTLVIILPG